MHIIISTMTFFSAVTTFYHVSSVIKDRVYAPLSGLTPVALWIMVVLCVFNTNYAYEH